MATYTVTSVNKQVSTATKVYTGVQPQSIAPIPVTTTTTVYDTPKTSSTVYTGVAPMSIAPTTVKTATTTSTTPVSSKYYTGTQPVSIAPTTVKTTTPKVYTAVQPVSVAPTPIVATKPSYVAPTTTSTSRTISTVIKPESSTMVTNVYKVTSQPQSVDKNAVAIQTATKTYYAQDNLSRQSRQLTYQEARNFASPQQVAQSKAEIKYGSNYKPIIYREQATQKTVAEGEWKDVVVSQDINTNQDMKKGNATRNNRLLNRIFNRSRTSDLSSIQDNQSIVQSYSKENFSTLTENKNKISALDRIRYKQITASEIEKSTFVYVPVAIGYGVYAIGKGVVKGVSAPFRKKFYTEEIPGTVKFTKGLVTGESGKQLREMNVANQIRNDPIGTAGFIGENIGFAKGFDATIKNIPVKPVTEKVGSRRVFGIDYGYVGKGKKLFSYKTKTGEFLEAPKTGAGTDYLIKNVKVEVNAPSTMLIEGKTIPTELVQEFAVKGIESSRELALTKSKFIEPELLKTQGTRYLTPDEATIVYTKITEMRGNVFGSSITQPQLKPELRREVGDIEGKFKISNEAELKSITENIYSELLKKKTSEFRIDPESPFHIEKKVDNTWQKAIELKGDGIGEGDLAPAKAYGYDLWTSKDFGKIGDVQGALLRGELKRKLTASTIPQKTSSEVIYPKEIPNGEISAWSGEPIPPKSNINRVFHHTDYIKNEGVWLTTKEHSLIHKGLEGKAEVPKDILDTFKVVNPKNEGTTLGVAHTGRYKDVPDLFRITETLADSKIKPTPKTTEFLKLKEKLGVKIEAEPIKIQIRPKESVTIKSPKIKSTVASSTSLSPIEKVKSVVSSPSSPSVSSVKSVVSSPSPLPVSSVKSVVSSPSSPSVSSVKSVTGSPSPLSVSSVKSVVSSPSSPSVSSVRSVTGSPSPPSVSSVRSVTGSPSPPSVSSVRSVTGSPSPGFSPSPSPYIPIRPSVYSPSSLKGSATPGFNVLVKREGKLERVNINPLSFEDAMKKGQFVVGTTARASYKIVPAFAPIKERFSGGVTYKQDFYKSKSGMFVEKRERRIKSSGELQEITFKGLRSKKDKKKNFKLFGGV